jgi:hypothetical protein
MSELKEGDIQFRMEDCYRTGDEIEVLAESFADLSEKTVRYIIKKEIRWQVRDLLDQLNISERIVYPGLDGLSQWLARNPWILPLE